MIFVAALVALHVGVIAWAGVDNAAARAALPIVQSTLALAGLAIAGVRRAMLDALARYWPAAGALLVLIIAAAAQAGAFSSVVTPATEAARDAAWRFAGFAMGALASIGAALAAGRRQAQSALLVGAIALGALAVIQQMQSGRGPFPQAEAAALFALLGALSVFAGIDALNPPRATRPLERRTTRAERLFLPVSALLAALIGLTLIGAIAAFGALALALAALGAGLLLRERRRGGGVLLLGAMTIVSLAVGATLFVLTRRAEQLTQPPLNLMTAAGALAWLALLVRLALTQDRRRRPSRGISLALAGLAVLAFAGAGATGPAPFGMLALILGLAGAHADALARVSPEPRSPDSP